MNTYIIEIRNFTRGEVYRLDVVAESEKDAVRMAYDRLEYFGAIRRYDEHRVTRVDIK